MTDVVSRIAAACFVSTLLVACAASVDEPTESSGEAVICRPDYCPPPSLPKPPPAKYQCLSIDPKCHVGGTSPLATYDPAYPEDVQPYLASVGCVGKTVIERDPTRLPILVSLCPARARLPGWVGINPYNDPPFGTCDACIQPAPLGWQWVAFWGLFDGSPGCPGGSCGRQ